MQHTVALQAQDMGSESAIAAKAFSDFIKQESKRLNSGALTMPRYKLHEDIDEEDEIEASAIALSQSMTL